MEIDSLRGTATRPVGMSPTPGATEGVTFEHRPSFEDFFRESHDPLVRALTLALGSPELGNDAASEGLTRALQRWRKVSKYDNPAGWVYRVGLNWGRSRLQKLSHEVHGAIDHQPSHQALSDPTMMAALHQLSVDHRSVVVGRYYLDWSEKDLAEALDIAPGTVKSRLSRALQQLGELLGDDDE